MTTKMTANRAGWFEKTVPAKLSRSTYMIWLLLIIAGSVLTGAFTLKHSVVQALHTQSLPAIESGLNLTADFRIMQSDVQSATKAESAEVGAKYRAEYNRMRDKTMSDLETTRHIAAPSGFLTVPLPGLPAAPETTDLLTIGFQTYEGDVNLVWSALDHKDAASATLHSEAAAKTLSRVIYPTAQKLYDSGAETMTVSFAQYERFNQDLTYAGYASAGVLLALICWQYMFMFANCKILLQATILTLLLAVVPFGYAHQGLHAVDRHLMSAHSADYPVLVAEWKSSIPLSESATLSTHATSAYAASSLFEGELFKAESGILYLPFAGIFFIVAGLFYQVAVSRALSDYR
jgi:hypothetical protein